MGNVKVILYNNPRVADITGTQILLQIQRHKRKGKYTVGLFRTKSVPFLDHIIQMVGFKCAGKATFDTLVSTRVRKIEDRELEHQYKPHGPINTCA